jgi:putative transcriptional regulator
MAIRICLDRLLVERRMSLAELADRVGLSKANLDLLKTGKARAIRFATLDALCDELNCGPGDLLAHEPGPGDVLVSDRTEDELE